jgi:RimJ/RimL family protein N-acetyltransferase
VIANCHPDNTASWRVLEKLGFVREGHLRRNVFFRVDADGRPRWQDTFEYGLLNSLEDEAGRGMAARHQTRGDQPGTTGSIG